jgi:hypothetical protein
MFKSSFFRNCLKLKEKTNIVRIRIASFLPMTVLSLLGGTHKRCATRHCEMV